MKHLKYFESKESLYREVKFTEYYKFIDDHVVDESLIEKTSNSIQKILQVGSYGLKNLKLDSSKTYKSIIIEFCRDLFYLNNTSNVIDYVDSITVTTFEDDWIAVRVQSLGSDIDRVTPMFYRHYIIDSRDGLEDFVEEKFKLSGVKYKFKGKPDLSVRNPFR